MEVKGLSKHFGGIRAIEDVSFSARNNSVFSIIGPNGAGKTTLFNCLTGYSRPSKGSVKLTDREISGLSPHEISHLGISRTFQNIRLFREMTVIENIVVAQHAKIRTGLVSAVMRTPLFRKEEKVAREKAYEYLQLLGLETCADKLSGSLSYGAQRKIEIARALATEASLLLLDEPAAGMNPQETDEMIAIIKNLRELGKTVLLIEHDMKVVMGISEHVMVLDHGTKIAEGTPQEIRNNQMVIEAYLGKDFH